MKRNLILLILIMALLISSFAFAEKEDIYNRFSDLENGKWYSDTMIRLIELRWYQWFSRWHYKANRDDYKGRVYQDDVRFSWTLRRAKERKSLV